MVTQLINGYVFPVILFGGFLYIYSQLARGQYASTDQNLVSIVDYQPDLVADGSNEYIDSDVDPDEDLLVTFFKFGGDKKITHEELLHEAKRLGLKPNKRWKRETLLRKIKEVID